MARTVPNRSSSTRLLVGLTGLWLATALLCPDAEAVDPHTLLSQYGHTAWRTQDGFGANPTAITQTMDGYIWIATSDGLERFDGVKFTPWTVPDNQSLPSKIFTYLLGARDGSLWIGTSGGLSHLKDGRLINYTTTKKSPGIAFIVEDHTGAIWVTRYQIHDGMGPLCRVAGTELKCYGKKDGIPLRYGLGLAEDSAGNLWLGGNVLCRWSPDSSSVYFQKELKQTAGYGVVGVATETAGSVWASLDGTGPEMGVRHYSGKKWVSYVVPGFNGAEIRSETLYVDSHKSLWVGTESKGLYRIHDGVAEHYGSADGLSGNEVGFVYEDREGNLWVLTDRGIDMFRDTPVVTYSTNEGIIGSIILSILALRNGSVWVGNEGAIDIIQAGGVSVTAAGHGLPGQNVEAMFEDSTGMIWLGVDDKIMTYRAGRFQEVMKPDGSPLGHIGVALGIAEDVNHEIWVVTHRNINDESHLLRLKDRYVKENNLLGHDFRDPHYVAADRDGGIWIGSEEGKLARYRNGKTGVAVPLGSGDSSLKILSISVDPENALWVATSQGLYRWKDGSLNVLDSRNGLPCSLIYSEIEDNSGSHWLYAKCGLLKIAALDWANWWKSPGGRIAVQVFDVLDGAQPHIGTNYQPIVSKAPDGRLWFADASIVQMVDPGHLNLNGIPPQVHIEEIIADKNSYSPQADIHLAPSPQSVAIRYTALSFSIPQRVRFRYMLQGQDKVWQDPGTRREAFYTNLAPGPYRFHVIACNSDGVWNETGAALSFNVSPAYYQTWWFRVLCVLAAAATLWFLYLLRLRQATVQIQARLGERMDERERIARELHDTLLQGFHGLMLRFQAVMEEIPETQPARSKMEKVLEHADEVLLEGRDRVTKLRIEVKQGQDLSKAIALCGEELAREYSAEFSMAIVGTPQPLDSVVLDDAYRIGREALVNAFEHSNASRIEGELTYDSVRLRLSIRDNGDGIDQEILKSGRAGHWGMSGMRERAEIIGGQLNIWSTQGAGTEVELIIPAKVAYQHEAKRPRWKWIKRIASGGR